MNLYVYEHIHNMCVCYMFWQQHTGRQEASGGRANFLLQVIAFLHVMDMFKQFELFFNRPYSLSRIGIERLAPEVEFENEPVLLL